jgi:peptide/nickel transport system substrate-binding protein
MVQRLILSLVAAALGLVALRSACGGGDAPVESQAVVAAPAPSALQTLPGYSAGPVEPDLYHPEHQPGPDGRRPPLPEPALGGEVTVHLTGLPARLNAALGSDTNTAIVLAAVHEGLTSTDYESWETRLDLARERWLEDQLVLADDAPAHAAEQTIERLVRPPDGGEELRERVRVLAGRVEDLGERWRVTPLAPGNPLGAPLELEKSQVREVVREGAVTFELREGVLWQPSPGFERHALDADDVLFSYSLYANPGVLCDERRYQYRKVALARKLDDLRVRFHVGRYDAWIVDSLGELPLLPRHLYDLTDPDHARHDPAATPQACAEEINDSRFNQEFVGLGPYRVTRFGEGVIEAERFEDYHDPARAGYLDRVRWRAIASDATAFRALLEGELDVFARLDAQQFLGPELERPEQAARLYRAWTSTGTFAYVGWNLHRPPLDELRVRRALSHCLDVEALLASYWGGLGVRVTGPAPYHSPGYDRDVQPVDFDLATARELLAQAEWFDRDGDGWVERDGKRLTLTYAEIAGAELSRRVGLMLQENLAKVGVELSIRQVDYATFREGILERAYDVFCQGWSPAQEPDPEQMWHSRWGAPGERSANYPGVQDPEIDRLIEAGQRESDVALRMELWRALHRRIDELAPFLFLAAPAMKMALPREVRGIQLFHVPPGYDLTRWYLPAGTPGTRAADGHGHWAASR